MIRNLIKKNEEIIRYLIVGVLTTVVSLALYFFTTCTFLNPKDSIEMQIANVISWIGAVIFAYVTNRVFVFRSKDRYIGKEFVKFSSSRVLTLGIDMTCMFLMVTCFCWNDRIAKLIVQVIITVSNYVLSKIFVFRNK